MNLPKELGKKQFIPYKDTISLKKAIQDKKIELGCYVASNENDALKTMKPVNITVFHDGTDLGMKERFEAYIGLPEDDNMTATLAARANSLLQSFLSQGLITAHKNLLVQRDAVDPTQWNISVKVQPRYGVNFILIKVSVGLL